MSLFNRIVKCFGTAARRIPDLDGEGKDPHISSLSNPLQEMVSQIRHNAGQMSNIEYGILIGAIITSTPCNLLVFGQGKDSALWAHLNKNGRTVFLENVEEWLQPIAGAETFLVKYPGLQMPPSLAGLFWDIILVDGPLGWKPEHPGRKESIRAASEWVANGGLVFVHDFDRQAEQLYCAQFLGLPTCTIDRTAIFKRTT